MFTYLLIRANSFMFVEADYDSFGDVLYMISRVKNREFIT